MEMLSPIYDIGWGDVSVCYCFRIGNKMIKHTLLHNSLIRNVGREENRTPGHGTRTHYTQMANLFDERKNTQYTRQIRLVQFVTGHFFSLFLIQIFRYLFGPRKLATLQLHTISIDRLFICCC